MQTSHFSTKQEGYGRQGLYFWLEDKKFYLHSIFPNVKEHYNAEHIDDCFFNEDNNTYTDCNGHIVTPVYDWDEFLFEKNKTEIGEVLYSTRFELEQYQYDFENHTMEEIAEWAFNL